MKIRIISPNQTGLKKRIIDVGAGVGIGFIFFYLSYMISSLIRYITIKTKGSEYYQTASAGSVNTIPKSLTVFEILIGVLILFFLVSFSEEVLFRGYLFSELYKKHPIYAYVISSFIFMIYHVFPGIVPLSTFITFGPYYFIFGILLAWIVKMKKFDLIMAIIAHGTFNSIIFIMLN